MPANVKLVGVRPIETRPVPVSVAVCGLLDALSTTLSTPVAAPAPDGVNTTEIVQLVFDASVLGDSGQVEV